MAAQWLKFIVKPILSTEWGFSFTALSSDPNISIVYFQMAFATYSHTAESSLKACFICHMYLAPVQFNLAEILWKNIELGVTDHSSQPEHTL